MFKRKVYNEIMTWKNTLNHKPLIVRGLRQIGKTTVVEKFAYDNYESVIKLDFRKDVSLHEIFDGDFDINSIIFALSLKYKNIKVIPNKTVLIFDELQDCPNARASLKYFSLDGRYDVICTGSLLGIKNYRLTKKPSRGIPVGFEDYIEMKPMDFEEFLWANDVNEEIFDSLKECFQNTKTIAPFIHNQLTNLFNKYICIGGMPEVVDTYIKTNNFHQAKKIQQRILKDFESDFGTHLNDNNEVVIDQSARTKISQIFNSIPRQLAKENQKFQYSVVNKNAKGREYGASIQWLEDYGLISKCYNLSTIEIPFDYFADDNMFKIYVNDTGLYIAMLDDDIAELIINNKLEIAKGAIYENIIADSFNKLNIPLYYFHKESGLEIDFVTKFNGDPVIVEVKAKKGNTKSAKAILENKEKYKIERLIKLTSQNIGCADNKYTYPYYMSSIIFKK